MSKPKTSSEPGSSRAPGRVVVLSAPSGGGKSTLAQAVIASTPDLVRSVTCTTRSKRGGEVDGRDYHFLTTEEFLARQRAGEFLESALVHGHWYGTSAPDVTRLCSQGLDVLLVIDYQGAAQLRQRGIEALYVFIMPPSLAVLEQRLRQRQSESEAALQIRLADAPVEMAQYRSYDFVIVNDDMAVATQQLQAIILADRCRLGRADRRYPIFSELEG